MIFFILSFKILFIYLFVNLMIIQPTHGPLQRQATLFCALLVAIVQDTTAHSSINLYINFTQQTANGAPQGFGPSGIDNLLVSQL